MLFFSCDIFFFTLDTFLTVDMVLCMTDKPIMVFPVGWLIFAMVFTASIINKEKGSFTIET